MPKDKNEAVGFLYVQPSVDLEKSEENQAGQPSWNSEKEFMTIKQGKETNELTKVIPTSDQVDIDSISKTAKISKGSVSIVIPDYDTLKSVNKNFIATSTWQLLDALTIEYTNGQKNADGNVRLSLSEYMERRGITSVNKAREQVNRDLDVLFNASYSWRFDDKKDYIDKRLISEKGIRNGVIIVKFTDFMIGVLKQSPVMSYPAILLKQNAKKNPNAYPLGRKLSEHKNMNIGKPNENIISVMTLLDVCPTIPSHDEVKSSKDSRHLYRRIIKPFEDALNALEDTLTWNYCHKNGNPLSDEEISLMDWNVFSSLNVQILWRNYPDQTKRIQQMKEREEAKKNEQKNEAKRPKKRGRPPKKRD